MKQKIIQKFVRSDKLKSFEVPFKVPVNIELIEFDIFIRNKSEETILDIGIKDSEKIRGWTGSNKTHFIITGEYATPGYLPGKIKPGIWNLLLSVYKIPEQGFEVVITINMVEKYSRWLKGDTHFHTCHSDGNANIIDFIKICKEIGFDYLISTNHNTNTQNYLLPTDTGITLIPGVELTTYHGHAALLGVNEPIKDYRCLTKNDIKNKFAETKKNGGFVGINHPDANDNEGCVWDWGFDLKYDWIEVWNDIWSDMNENALKRWHNFLCAGKKIPIIGGSDNHKILKYRTESLPVTYVYSKSIEKEDILGAFSKGRCYVSLNDGPHIESMISDSFLLGDVSNRKSVKFTISSLKNGDIIRVITNKGIESEVVIVDDDQCRYESEFIRGNQLFIRIEIRRINLLFSDNEVVLISNPIYFEI
jgi:hypothetical protein